ncbi:MAG: hypothetical protein CMH61_01220 [Nanoarchaeota archaeon]|nr:hypothetical protein [Nanoarchaeota archaeon]|tara:strand:+ start:2665 stop:3138 length:474 start_codon:yes stop_codon:yes gene_type:complete
MSHEDFIAHPKGSIPTGSFCKSCMRYNSRYSVVDALIMRDEKILLMKRATNPKKGWWAFSGGFIDWDETLEQACVREVKEEVGLVSKSVKLFGVYSSPSRDSDGSQKISHCYIVETEGEVSIDPSEVIEVQWFYLDNLPSDIAFDHRQMIEDYKKTL